MGVLMDGRCAFRHRLYRLRNRDWNCPFNLLALNVSPARASTIIPSTATSSSHPDAFVISSGTSAMQCIVLTPSTQVWRVKSTLFSFLHPLLGRYP